MTPDPLFERLQRALQPDYRLEREIGSGGMGRVYLAHETALKRDVAVKLLRPELATAQAAAAFLREARILAGVRHPNIVVIYRAGEADGLHFYAMELVDGPTLEERLHDGPLTAADVVKLGRDLLDGLESVHRAGLVHRDVKPGNIFLLPQRALLGDFGIAQPPATDDAAGIAGTPGYLAPEQLMRGPVTALTDLYATAAVLYEALTGRRYPPLGEGATWDGVPHAIAVVLRRALRVAPAERWPDARTFRHALWRTRTRRYVRRTILLTVAGLIVGGAGGRMITGPPAGAVSFARFEYAGPVARRPLADSLATLVRDDLGAHIDFFVATGRRLLLTGRGLEIGVRVTVSDSHMVAQLVQPAVALPPARVALSDWVTLRDSLSYRVLFSIWDVQSPLAPHLPTGALPRTPLGLSRFLDAERLLASAQWESAYHAYRLAEATDSTCRLCSWRLHEVERWLNLEHDPARTRRFLAHAESFGPRYASLIRSSRLPIAARLDSLSAVTQRWPDFFPGWFQLGDELLHRGPLAGHSRSQAVLALQTAVRRQPGFGPAWEHLAWACIPDGDSACAAGALDSLRRRAPPREPYSATLHRLLDLAFAWRFLDETTARAHTRAILRDPVAAPSADLAAGPRLLAGFDAPRGARAVGEILAAGPARDLQQSGLVAQMLAAIALGQPDRARALDGQLAATSPEGPLAAFGAELEDALTTLDPPTPPTPQAAVAKHARARARGILAAAEALAGQGHPAAAVALTDTLDIDRAARERDPFYRTVARLRRAEWLARLGNIDRARRELRWHEHFDLVGLPTGPPQAAEIDWAFASLARWRLARLLDQSGSGAPGHRSEACRAYAAVARAWAAGEPRYRARADTAAARLTALGCPTR